MRQPLCLFFWIVVFAGGAAAQEARYWALPQELNDGNVRIEFHVDSTWHLVHGRTKGIHGRVYLADPSDYRTVRAEVYLPVAHFDTENRMRDNKMRAVMAADKYPEVVMRVKDVQPECAPAELQHKGRCGGTVRGVLSIRGVEHEISFPAGVELREDKFVISGAVDIRWPEYGVEDPSILVAKLDESVKVDFELALAGAQVK